MGPINVEMKPQNFDPHDGDNLPLDEHHELDDFNNGSLELVSNSDNIKVVIYLPDFNSNTLLFCIDEDHEACSDKMAEEYREIANIARRAKNKNKKTYASKIVSKIHKR